MLRKLEDARVLVQTLQEGLNTAESSLKESKLELEHVMKEWNKLVQEKSIVEERVKNVKNQIEEQWETY